MLGRLVCAALVAVVGFGPASAATLTVQGGTGCPTPRGFDQTAFNPPGTPLPNPEISAQVSGNDRGCSGSAEAIAGRGFVGGIARSDIDEKINGQFANSSFTASAEFSIGLLIPGDWDGNDIPIQVSAVGDAVLEALTFARVGGSGDATRASIRFELLVRGNTTSSVFPAASQKTEIATAQADGNEFSPVEPRERLNVQRLLESDVLLIDPTRPFTVRFTLSGSSLIANGIGSAAVNSFNTFGFNPNGPAIILPDGFVATSEEASLVNNMWIDPRVSAEVPLPAGAVLLLSGIGILAARGAFRSRRTHAVPVTA